MLPQPGEIIVGPDGDDSLLVAWCSGWTMPKGYELPTRYYAQPRRGDEILRTELPVIPARDTAGVRFWIAERRLPL